MRIVFVNKYYWPPHLGGIENHLHMLAGELASREDFDVTAVVANEGRETVRETVDGVDVFRLARTVALASTPVAPSMSAALRAEAASADIVHMHFPYPWGDIAWQTAGAPGPAVLTYHSDIVRQKRLLRLYEPVMRRMLDRVERVIVGSPQMIEHSPYLVPHAEKCRVVPFGIDVRRFAAEDPALDARAAELRAAHERPVVLFVGRLIYYKGVDVLVRAMAEVDADLVIVGTGPLEGELRQIGVAHGVSDRLTFLPPMPDDELRAWYRAADVFALPSVARTEAYGLVQLEAHASGTPVVSTNLPTGVPFVNEHGTTGLTVEPADVRGLARALHELVSDEVLRTRLGRQARERALAHFSIEGMVDATVQVYHEALGKRA